MSKTRSPESVVTDDDVTRFFDELYAAPTRTEAGDVFADADWIFINMNPKKREALYCKIEDIINEKPE